MKNTRDVKEDFGTTTSGASGNQPTGDQRSANSNRGAPNEDHLGNEEVVVP